MVKNTQEEIIRVGDMLLNNNLQSMETITFQGIIKVSGKIWIAKMKGSLIGTGLV